MPSTSLDLRDEILRLKKERNAVILAHNYQTGDIQDLADYVGDSLGLAYQAQETDADVIAFCGVHFMAETAKIVNPEKIVVLPDKDAGCSLEESCPAEDLEKFINDNRGKELLRHRLHQLLCWRQGALRCDLHIRQCRKNSQQGAIRPSYPLCPRCQPRCLGHGANRPQNGSLAGCLLCSCRVHP